MSTFKEKFKEVMDDLGGRIKNPLITTFILVWLYKHWLLIFVVFSFNDFTLVGKVRFLVTYIKSQEFYGMIWSPILWSFMSLIVYYLIAIIAQLVKLLIGNQFNAAVITLFDKRKYVLKTEHDKIKKLNKDLKASNDSVETTKEVAVSKLKQKEAEFETKEKNLNRTISIKDNEIGTLKADLSTVQKQRIELQSEVETLKTENLKIDKLTVQLNAEKEENKIKYAEIQRLQELLKYKTPLVYTNPYEVFGDGIWELSFYNSKGNLFKERFVLVGNDTFALVTSNEKIKITDFKYIKDKNTIEFNKTNKDKGYANVYTRLVFFDDGLLVGKEGNLSVTYTKDK